MYGAQSTQQQTPEWSHLYTRIFSEEDAAHNKGQKELIFSKTNIPNFTQLIPSWNAVRPVGGHFSLWVQARDQRTKRWDNWYHVADWGDGIQRSYMSDPGAATRFFHVRLEALNAKEMDGFKLRIQAHGAADIAQVRTLAVNTTHNDRFVSEVHNGALRKLSSLHIAHVPHWSQMTLNHERSDALCSPTSCSMLVSYLNKKIVDPLSFARKAYDGGLDAYGSWPFNAAGVFELSGQSLVCAITRLNSFIALHGLLQKGIPVALSIRGALKGSAKKSHPHGHFLVVVGFDGEHDQVICHDPAFPDDEKTVVRYDRKNFLAAWENSKRLVYLISPVRSVMRL